MATQLERPRTLAEFQKMFCYIYERADQHYSHTELVARLIEEITAIMELARKDEQERFPEQLARIFSWYCSVANLLGISLQEALWQKYPGVCSYCLREENCICAIEHPDIPDKEDALRRLRRERHGREPETLRDHQALHHRLYYRQNRRIFPIQTAAHLAEEAGEVSRSFRRGDLEALEGEMADVASWIFALANRVVPSCDLSDAIWRQYPYECEKCRKDQCQCPDLP